LVDRGHEVARTEQARLAIERIMQAAAADPRVAPLLEELRSAQAQDGWSAGKLERRFRKAARRLEQMP
jgi:hypothetical protein